MQINKSLPKEFQAASCLQKRSFGSVRYVGMKITVPKLDVKATQGELKLLSLSEFQWIPIL
jgi:hypothetical protein